MQLIERVQYMMTGVSGRLSQRRHCPSCAGYEAHARDRKWFHTLFECSACGLAYRYPVETAAEMAASYENGYDEPGLTTDLPSDEQLSRLIETGFSGSEKDFYYHIDVLRALGLREGDRVLDYGANWGYASWQFARAGFIVTSFDISKTRAAFGGKLGLTIHTDLSKVGSGFDVVYSSHVLEHTSDPATVIKQQFALVRRGGLVVAHTPNASRASQQAAPGLFHRMWGRFHPVLLTDRFVQTIAGDRPFLITSNDDPSNVGKWDKCCQWLDATGKSGLFFAIRSATT